MKKSISKSVRLSQEVYDYIDGYAGEGFNQKFENIILFAKRTEKDRCKHIKKLDADIEKRQMELSVLQDKIRELHSRINAIDSRFYYVETAFDDMLKFFYDDENLEEIKEIKKK